MFDERKKLIEAAKLLKNNCRNKGGCEGCIDNDVNCFVRDKNGDKSLPLNWIIPTLFPKLSDEEMSILKNLDSKWKYIARDFDGELKVYIEDCNGKHDCCWINDCECADFPFAKTLSFITWNDEQAVLIADLLEQ